MRVWTYIFIIQCMLFTACDHIDENDRLIEVETGASTPTDEGDAAAVRNVLLEDFTGQRCANCPTGTTIIEQLEEAYGERVIAVSIHGGPLGFYGSDKVVGLATSAGDEYYDYWKLTYQPVGLINRHGAVNYTDWIATVNKELSRKSQNKMELRAALVGDNVEVTVSDECLDGLFVGKLQVWLLEDGITAIQTMPDGTNNRDYVHNHVLRTPVNGVWGTDFSIAKGESETVNLTQKTDSNWRKENLSVIAFLYNGNGVEQVIKAKVKTE